MLQKRPRRKQKGVVEGGAWCARICRADLMLPNVNQEDSSSTIHQPLAVTQSNVKHGGVSILLWRSFEIFNLTCSQPQCSRTAGVASSHGEASDEGFHVCMSLPTLLRSSDRFPDCKLQQMYSKMVDKCFDDCINDFTSKSINNREEGCIMRCWDKNMKSQERIQARFAENNEAMMSSGGLPR